MTSNGVAELDAVANADALRVWKRVELFADCQKLERIDAKTST
jgi:hypothetical protein